MIRWLRAFGDVADDPTPSTDAVAPDMPHAPVALEAPRAPRRSCKVPQVPPGPPPSIITWSAERAAGLIVPLQLGPPRLAMSFIMDNCLPFAEAGARQVVAAPMMSALAQLPGA